MGIRVQRAKEKARWSGDGEKRCPNGGRMKRQRKGVLWIPAPRVNMQSKVKRSGERALRGVEWPRTKGELGEGTGPKRQSGSDAAPAHVEPGVGAESLLGCLYTLPPAPPSHPGRVPAVPASSAAASAGRGPSPGPAAVAINGLRRGRQNAVTATHPETSKMSYTLDSLGNPSAYRRVTETRSGFSRLSGSPSSGFRSQSWSRSSPSTVSSSYKRSALGPRLTYSSAMLSSAESSLDFSQSSSLLNGVSATGGDYKLSRSNEKEQLQGLNDRFAGYIEKVHYLEQQNKEIEAEIQALRQKQASHAQLGDAYDQEIRELRATLEMVNHEKAQVQLDSDHLEEDIHRLKERFEEEARLRDDTEAAIRALRKDIEEASLVKVELDKKVQSLQDEVAFLRSNHEEEVADLLAQIQASHITVERKDYLKTDISSALKEIRSQLECHSDQNMHQAEEWFKCRYAKLTEAAEQNKEAIRSAKEEIAEYRRQLQSKSIELESVRGTKESLERQLSDIEERHNHDLSSYQVGTAAARPACASASAARPRHGHAPPRALRPLPGDRGLALARATHTQVGGAKRLRPYPPLPHSTPPTTPSF